MAVNSQSRAWMPAGNALISAYWMMFAGVGITALALVFVVTYGEVGGRIFWHLLALQDTAGAGLMIGILLLGLMAQRVWAGSTDTIDNWLQAIDRHRVGLALAIWGGLSAASLSLYRNHPVSMDEYAAVFQAKVFAAGAMHGVFPPGLIDYLVPSAFQNQFLMVNGNTGAVFSAYWPGFSLLLAPFVVIGAPWACNPMLVALSLLLIRRVTWVITASELACGWALLFAIASPALLVNGISYYAMPAHLFFNLLFALLLLAPTPGRLFLAGVVGGMALVLHNPFPHLVFALPWWMWLALRDGRRFSDFLWLGLGYLPVVAVLGLGWTLWQRALLSVTAGTGGGTAEAAPVLARLGSLALRFLGFFQMPTERVIIARLAGLAKLWLWASPLLLLLAWWGGRTDSRSAVRLLGASALTTFFAYFLVKFDQGHGWGYRYFHSAWAVLPILAALGVLKFGARSVVVRGIFAATVLFIVLGSGLRLWQVSSFVDAHLAQFPPRITGEPAVVLHNGRGYYARDLIQNDPWLRDQVVVMLCERKQSCEDATNFLNGGRQAARSRFGEVWLGRLNVLSGKRNGDLTP